MWGGEKKAESPARTPLPQQPSATVTSTSASSFSGEAKKMAPLDSTYPATAAPTGAARLGSSLHVKGEITGNEDLHIDGSVEGLVHLEERRLTIGASAKLTADIIAREVVVYGNVKGNLRARDRIEIKKDGSVVGDLTTARIMIEDGAYFKGSIEIDKTGDASENSYEKSSNGKSSRSALTASTTSTSAV